MERLFFGNVPAFDPSIRTIPVLDIRGSCCGYLPSIRHAYYDFVPVHRRSPMNLFDAIVAIAAFAVLFLGVISGYVRNRLWLSEPAICLAVGVILSPLEFELLDMTPGSEEYLHLFKQLARITLAISVLGAALRLPNGYMQRHWRELAIVLGIGLPLMCLATSALAYGLLPVSVLTALLLGSTLGPTDPVLADSIVTGKSAEENVPERLRNAISAESGANDGLGILLVMIPVLLMTQSTAEAVEHWLLETLLWQVMAAVAIGWALGWIAGRALLWSSAQPYTEAISGLTVSVSLALSTVACVHLVGSSGILATFAAGLVFRRYLLQVEDPRHEHMQAAISRFFELPIFLLLGLSTPWNAWSSFDWPVFIFALSVLVLRRLPSWWVLRPALPTLQSRRDTLFNGWFGPTGIAALYYAAESSILTGSNEIWSIVSLVVFASIIVHGICATPLAIRFGRR